MLGTYRTMRTAQRKKKGWFRSSRFLVPLHVTRGTKREVPSFVYGHGQFVHCRLIISLPGMSLILGFLFAISGLPLRYLCPIYL